MDSALVRNAQAARSKVQECDDAHNYLTSMTSAFSHTALDYVFQVSIACQQASLTCRYFSVSCLKDLYNNTKNHYSVDFIKETHLFNLL